LIKSLVRSESFNPEKVTVTLSGLDALCSSLFRFDTPMKLELARVLGTLVVSAGFVLLILLWAMTRHEWVDISAELRGVSCSLLSSRGYLQMSVGCESADKVDAGFAVRSGELNPRRTGGFQVPYPDRAAFQFTHTPTYTQLRIALPFYLLTPAFGVLSVIGWSALHNKTREFLRHRKGLCARCGYDLRASNSVCPECGERRR
jgi:hypothetical protein